MRSYIILLAVILVSCNDYPISSSRAKLPVDINEQCRILEKKKSSNSRNPFRSNPKYKTSGVTSPTITRSSAFRLSHPFEAAVEGDRLFPAKTLIFDSDIPQRFSKVVSSPEKKHFDLISSNSLKSGMSHFRMLKRNSNTKNFFQWIVPKVNRQVPILAFVAGVFSFLAFRLNRKRSMNLSHWAKNNPWKARGSLTAIHLATAAGSFLLGDMLALDNMMISDSSKIVAISILGASALLYPLSNTEFKPAQKISRSDIRRMSYAGTFLSAAFLILHTGNQFELQKRYVNTEDPIVAFSTNVQYSISNVTLTRRDFQERVVQKDNVDKKKTKLSGGEKFLLTILALAGFVGLAYLVLALSCSLACSGAEGAAYLVLFGGGALLIFLLITVLKGIYGKRKSKKKADEVPELSFK